MIKLVIGVLNFKYCAITFFIYQGVFNIKVKSKILILTMLICFCLTINGLWAANLDETTNTITLSENTSETVTISNVNSEFDKLRDDNSLNVTKADSSSNDVGDEEEEKVYSFTDFGKLIKYTPDELVLDGDIIYNASIDGDGLVIAKNHYVIDFNGHCINANWHTGTLLTVSGNNVVFKNLKFINGKGIYSSKRITEGGKTFTSYTAVNYPILWSGDDGVIDLSEFTSSETVLKWTGSNGLINNSYFHDSKYEQIYVDNDYFDLENTLFERLSGLHSSEYVNGHTGYHVNLLGDSKVIYCNFSDISEASLNGDYTVLSYSNFTKTHGNVKVSKASHCIFDSVYRPYQHVYSNQPHYLSANTIEFCTFQNFSISTSYHCAIAPCGIGSVIRNCTFINNKVPALFKEALGGIFNSTFINNVIYEYTLGYNTKSSYTNAYFNGCTFINNEFWPGYVISCAGNIRIFNCQFFNNTAKNELFYINSGSTLFIKNSNFSTKNVYNGWAVKLANSNQNLVFLDNLSNFYNQNPISPTTYNNETFLHIYVNQTGGGDGLSPDSPTSISNAVSKIAFDGVIEFVNNGQVYNSYVPVVNKRITFIGNNVTFSYSGTVFDVRADYVNIFGFNFIKCGNSGATTIRYFRPDKDGIIYNYLTIKHCNFINNIGQIAGCIQNHHKDQKWYFGGYNLLVDNCTFINNTASTYMNQNSWTENGYRTAGLVSAGAIQVFSSANIINCIFEGNAAPTGGAVSFDYGCRAVVENCSFRNNHASTLSSVSNNGRGGFQTAGAIVMHAVNSKSSLIKNCTFENNYAPMAGAIYAQGVENLDYGQQSRGKVSISDCTFINNTAVNGNGGAVYFYSNNANIVNCIFKQNNASNGGAIYLNGNKINIINSSFTANFANHEGTLFLSENTAGIVNIIGSNFTQMNVPINFLRYNVKIDKSSFYNNANGTIFGNYDTTTLTISNTFFTNNSGRANGSAIYYRGQTIINASSFINNSASAYGGALFLTQEQCRITYSEFRGNVAVDGGAVFAGGDELYVSECKFTNNNATHPNTLGGGGAIFVDGNFVQLYNSIFQFNYATYYGGAIFINGTNRFYAVNSKVRMNFNNTNYCDGPDPRVGKYGVELPPFNAMKFDKEFNYHDIYEYAAMELIEEVYVLKYPTAIPNNNFTGDRQNPVTFHDALQMVAPNGKIIFINSSEIYTQFHDGTPYGGSQLTFTRGFSIFGNDTTIVNLRFLIDQDNFKIYNIKFTGCNDSVVIFDGYNGYVENCTFSDNCIPESVFGGYGLGMVVLKENMTVINTKFINNAIESNDDIGGALFINASNIVVNNCTFKNNTGRVSHLYICEGLETITIRNSVFKDGGKVDADGVGILLNSMNNIKILNCNFTNISATQGGAIRIGGVFFMLNLNGNIFTGNSANDGGAAYITIKTGSDIINLNRNIYNNNTALNNGGALYINSTYKNIVISYSNFTANKATINGGAIFMASTTTVSASNFIANVADRGGAIYIGATGVRIRDSNFTYNNATLGSAIFHASKSQTTLNKLYVAENHVFGEDTAGYGDICIDDALFSIPNDDVVFNYFTGTPKYMNYIGNCSSFNLNVVYVSHNGTGLGTTSSTPTTMEKALIILVKINSTIVFCEDMNVTATLSNFTNLVVRSNVGRYYTLKRKDGKNVFVVDDGSNITIRNLGLAGGVEVNSNNCLYLENVTVSITDAESEGIVYKTSTSGEIFNSTFIGNKNLDYALIINGKVNIDESSFINNNLTCAAVYYNSTGSGCINNSYFSNNSVTIGVRNLNITNFNNVDVVNNDFDAIVSNVKISNDVYGENVVINGTFDVGVNFAVENITFILNNTFKTNSTLTVTKESLFSFNLNAGILAASNYNITAYAGNLKNMYSIKYTNNNFNVKRANVASNNLIITEVIYGVNDTIKIKGYFNQTTAGIKYGGVVNVTITNENATISNATVEVIDGEFIAVLSDCGRLGVGKYDVIVSNNGQSNNENFTVSNYTFRNNFTVSKTNIAANYTANVTVVYGMNDTIIIEGTFNASKGIFAKLYNGNITVTVTNNIYSIFNDSVVVRDGKFSSVLVDGGKLGVGIYNIVISPNSQSTNDNYTVVENIFANKVNVTKSSVGANYTGDITVIYGMNDTIIIEGTFNASYGADSSKYNGVVTVTINNAVYSISNSSVVVRDGKFKAILVDGGKLGVGIYNISVSSNIQSLNVNYTVVNNTFVNKVNVTKAVVGANYTANITVVYGMNDTIIVEGTFNTSAGVYSSKFNGNVTVTISNNYYSIDNVSVVVSDGKFKAIIINQPQLAVGMYNITVSSNNQSLNDNYTVLDNIFVNKLNVEKASVICHVNEITIVYGVNNTITISGNVSNSTYGVKYNGFVNITIPNTDMVALNVEVRNGEFICDLVDKGNLTVGCYAIDVKSSYINDNYTFTNATFNNKILTVPANVTAFDLINVTVVYGVNKTIAVLGKISNSTYGVKYNGFINITITNANKTIRGYNILVVNGTFNADVIDMGNLTSGKYNVSISSNYINNYTVISKTFADIITVLKYDVYGLIEKVNVTYGADTINIYGNVSNSDYGQLYNGFIDVVVGNHTYSNVEVADGQFTVVINDLSDYNVSINNVSISQAEINENYILNNASFTDYFIVVPAASSINISPITGRYASVVEIPIITENITSLIVSVYTKDGHEVSDINITIDGVDSVYISGLNIGEYVINLTGIGDNNHIGCNASTNITVLKATSKLTVENISIVYAPGNITVWYDVINATISSFEIFDENNNSVSCTIKKYLYSFEIMGLAAGKYTFNVTADGGINHENASSISNIVIKPAGSKVVVPVCLITYGEHGILNVSGENITGISSVTIFDERGRVVGNYSINNLTVDVWNLNSSQIYYRVKVTSAADENHTGSTGIGLVFVKKADSAILVPDNFNMTYGDVKTVTIKLKNLTSEDIVRIYVVLNGETVNCSISQNGTNISISGLAVGNYALIVESRATTNYNASVGAGNFRVLRAGSNFSIPSKTNMSHLGGNITIKDVVNATGFDVKLFDAKGNQIKVSLVGYDIIFSRLDVGNYTLNVTTIVDSNHTSFSQISTVNVMKMLSPSIVNITGIINGIYDTSNASVKFNIINRTVVSVLVFKNGTDICIYNNTNFTGDIFTIGNLNSGFYNITISNAESDYFNESKNSVLFEIKKAPSFVKIINVTDGAVNNTNATVRFDVINRTAVKIMIINLTGDVVLTFNEFSGNFISIGNLTKGLYTITILNGENENYAEYVASATFKFTYKGSIIASGISRGYNSPYDYVAIFTDEVGIPLNNSQVQMIVDGQIYNVTTNDKGEAYLTETTLSVGLHNVTLYNPLTDETETYTTNIVERLQENKDIVMDFCDGSYYKVRAYGDDGQPIAGVYVIITVNGVDYDVKTDKNGYASLKVRLNPDVFKITAEWKDYKVNKIVVKQTLKANNANVKKSAKKFVYSATLKWSSGKAIAGKLITFKFKGKTYKAKTNSKGIAKITIKKSVLKKLKAGKKYKISVTYKVTDKGYTSVNTIVKTIKVKK